MKTTPKSPLRDIVARNMRKLRAERSWSQEFLANEAGLNLFENTMRLAFASVSAR
ncbi:hypothetical protein [Celeribacter baekdonensis]|uniref:hypothetical protein n=1 Tax=Celeribacter baekdonensis TaxID=875171 RepID=UPI000AD2FD41|nr:hypothetical protein [Celeribacter baekdonensis]